MTSTRVVARRTRPAHGEGVETLSALAPRLVDELKVANARLAQRLTPAELLEGVRRTALKSLYGCTMMQPSDTSNYAWSDRTVPLVLCVREAQAVRVRIVRGRSYRGGAMTPAKWKELRGFPRGDVKSKFEAWSAAEDGATIRLEDAQSIARRKIPCFVQDWDFDLPD